MRIVIATVQVPFVSGGAEAHATGLQRALQVAGHDAEIISFPFNPSIPERIPDQMLACRLLDLTKIHGTKTDLLIGLKFPAYLIPHPNKVVWLLHQHRAAYDLWNHPFENLNTLPHGVLIRDAIRRGDQLLREARAIFANSKNVANRLRHFSKIDASPLYHPPPNAELFQNSRDVGDYFFFPSRLGATKRQSLIIEALSLTKEPVRVRFCGIPDSPNYAKHLDQLAEKAGVKSRVEWLGFVSEEEKRKQYADCVGVIFPPVDEDYGYITLEAMLAAKGVITCEDSGAPLEFVLPNNTGLIVKPRAEMLAAALDKLWKDRALAADLGRHARKVYRDLNLSWTEVVKRLLA